MRSRRVGIVSLGVAHDHEFEVGDERVVALEQREIDLDALAHGGIGEVLEQSLAVRRAGDAFPEGVEPYW